MRGLAGRIALVTGAGRGIGRAAAERLAAEGARVAVTDRDVEAAQTVADDLNGLGIAAQLDVTDRDSVAAGVREVERALGPVDVLVNNAGWSRFQPFVESDEDAWARILAVNLRGVLTCTRAVLPAMLERGAGRIVNVSSDAGRVGSSGEAVYAAAKAGVVAFSKTIARESASRGVTVNAVCPGPVDTPLLSAQAELLPGLVAALRRSIPLGRVGQPDDVAGVIAFLASDDAGYLTGQTVSVSGGLTML